MKKILCTLLAVLMLLLSMVACSPQTDTPESTKTTNEETKPTESTQGDTKKPTEDLKEEQELKRFSFPLEAVACKVPTGYGRKTNRSIAIATGSEAFLATVYNGRKGDFTGDLEDMLASVAERYVQDSSKYLSDNIVPAELKADTKEKVTVSGYEAVKFSGTAKTEEGKENIIYGYSMLINEVPVVFMGVLVSDDQAKADLDDMKDLIDLMAGSIYK